MMDQALRFLLDVAFGFMTYAFLLRFMMQWLRAPFRNPAGQAITALTDWAVKPLRRVVPGFKGQDTSTLLLAWLTQYLWLLATVLVVRRVVPDGSAVLVFALFAVVELFKAAIWVLMVAVIVQAVLSWVGPEGPLAGFLNAMTFRFLAPIRRVVPLIGGTLDLSPLILIVLLQLVLMVPIPWLESFVLGIAA
jgi:YggT family protein